MDQYLHVARHGVQAAHRWPQVRVMAMLDLPRALDPVHRLTIHYLNHQFVNVQLLRDHLVDTKHPDLLHVLVQGHAMTDVFAAHAHLKNENDIDHAVVIHDTVDEGTVLVKRSSAFLSDRFYQLLLRLSFLISSSLIINFTDIN